MLVDAGLFDIWISVKLSNGDVLDIDAPQLEELKQEIQSPEFVQLRGHVSIEKVNVMSRVAVGVI